VSALLPPVPSAFDRILHLLATHGRGRTLADLGACYALAMEFQADEPDLAHVADLVVRLGLNLADVEAV